VLTARGITELGAARMDWAVAFARRMRVFVVDREGLMLNTRYVPPSVQPANRGPCLYILLRGTWRLTDRSFEASGPAAFVVSGEHLEGGDGMRSLTYQAGGAHFVAIELHLDALDTPLRARSRPIAVALDDRTLRAAERVAEIRHKDDRDLAFAVLELLGALEARLLIDPQLVERAAQPTSPAFRLLWTALRPLAERLELLPTVQQVGTLIGANPQTVDRRVRAFVAASGLVGPGWRAASRHLRLKVAVVMLSAKGASVSQVARVVGYGSSIAMCRAFRDAKLPSPGAVQQALAADELFDSAACSS
jgi:AraC-like DNA-binding protein